MVWLLRFRHRCGYGVHSPFAFSFLRDVVYEDTPYYIYEDLDGELAWWQRMRVRRVLHLMMRLVNWHQPAVLVAPNATRTEKEYLHAGCVKARLLEQWPEGTADLCYLKHPDEEFLRHISENTLLIMDNLKENAQWFRQLPCVVSMDLWDIGIAFFNPQYNKQHYIIDF